MALNHATQYGTQRWSNKQQHPPATHLHRTAHLDLDFDLDTDLNPTYPSSHRYSQKATTLARDGTRPRGNFRMTRTLKDAFEATSRTSAMDAQRAAPLAERPPSPRRRHQRSYTLPSPYAEIASPPPADLLETYKQINDADYLADLVSEDEQGFSDHAASRRSSSERRRRDSPGGTNERHARTNERDEFLDPGLSYLDDIADNHVRGTLSSYRRDEERLSRVTSSQSPVFSKARVGSKADGLQRRESDPRTEQITEDQRDEVEGPSLALNVPKTWGKRSSSHRRWINSITGNTPRAEAIAARGPDRERRPRVESRSRSPRLADDSPSRYGRRTSRETTLKSERSRLGDPPKDGLHNTSRARSRSLGRNEQTGDTVLNPPVTVHKTATRLPSQRSHGDSRELLRKLARAESPAQQSMPVQQKPDETSLPQKTPVVIGAWVDTPMTVRNTESNPKERNTESNPKDDTTEIESPSRRPNRAAPAKEPRAQIRDDSSQKNTIQRVPSHSSLSKKISKTKSNEISDEKSSSLESNQRTTPELVKPKLPKSALETFIEDAKSNGNPLSLGDDTIASLEGLMEGNDEKISSQFSKMKEEELKMELEGSRDTGADFYKNADKQRNSLDHLCSKLQSMIHNIQDARAGLAVIERYIVPGNEKALADEIKKQCEICGNAQHNHGEERERVYLAIPIPRLWRRDVDSKRLRPTYLGWATLVLGFWYIIESIMCDIYCHPTVAEVCDGYCLRPDAPQYPFVLPTMLWRWSHLSYILTPIITLFFACARLIAQLLGLWDGYVDDDPPLTDAQWVSSSNPSSLDDALPIGSSAQYGFRQALFDFWPLRGPSRDSAMPVMVSSFSATSSIAPIPTILQNVLHASGADEMASSMDDDEEI